MGVTHRLKATARSALRPFWLRVWQRIEARTNTMLNQRMEPFEERMRSATSWQQHAPAFLNAVSTVGAFGHQLQSHRKESLAQIKAQDDAIAGLRAQVQTLAAQHDAVAGLRAEVQALAAEQVASSNRVAPLRVEVEEFQKTADRRLGDIAARVEFVRQEILFEMKYAGSGSKATSAPSGLTPRIVTTDKFEAAGQAGLRLNVGCGHIPLDGYLNVDMRELPGVDIIAEAGDIPVEQDSLAELRSAHLLEHFPQEELRRRLLPYWRSLLRPGGAFTAVVPDGEAMLAHSAAGTYPFEDFRNVLFGAQDYTGDFHFNLFTPDSLRALLEEAGFVDVRVPVKGRRNGQCYEFEIHARKP